MNDIDALHELGALATGIAATNAEDFDLTADGRIDLADRDRWLSMAARANGLQFPYQIGDGNLDGRFNSADIVAVFQAGEYDDGIPSNSVWSDGDWNGDREFDSSDLVSAFREGGYEEAARAVAVAVPEPLHTMAGGVWLSAIVWFARRPRPRSCMLPAYCGRSHG